MKQSDTFFADPEKIKKQALRQKNMYYEAPLPENVAKLTDEDIPYEVLSEMAQEAHKEFKSIYDKNKALSDEQIRLKIIENRPNLAKLAKANWTIWSKFTDREKDENTRQKMLQTILIAQKVTRGQLDPEEAKAYVSDLMGVNEQKRAEIRSQL